MNAFERLLAEYGEVASPLPFALNSRPCLSLDLTTSNPDLAGFDPGDTPAFSAYIRERIALAGAAYAAGGYAENRQLYAMSKVFNPGGAPVRTLHLGIDLWLKAGTAVHAVLPGTVYSAQDNPAFGDYGPTMIVEHASPGQRFYTLYGHLATASLEQSPVGKRVQPGDVIGWLGDEAINVGWPPHLHFQIIRDLLGWYGDYPGVCLASEADLWLQRCPDPNLLLRIAELPTRSQH